ncbi:hypothetical protein COV18_07435 [Candidatus Woesearchaeota archaeon CG10_big_fil_rev_8_21_14_0_10_37_12]|nr:MAG: hypothetical protein COV18_07435 [Candidatus Woesearchaeota archaeon CG10_big_fil_rev_8_21_14_0_10_37_12]
MADIIGADYYDQIAAGYNQLHGEEQLRKAQIIANEINVKPDDVLLDVGCGTAHTLALFNCIKIGVDPSKKLLEQATVPVMHGVAENLHFPNDSFDHVISITAVHNFADVEKGLHEIRRVAKKNIALSILKKADNFEEIEKLITTLFVVKKKIDDVQDIVYICEKK